MFRIMCIYIAVLSGLYAACYTLAPLLTASFYLPEANADTALLGRYFGAALWFAAIVCWLLKDTVDAVVQKAVAAGGVVNAVVGLVTSLIFTLNGQMTAFGWGPVIIFLIAAVGWVLVMQSRAVRAD